MKLSIDIDDAELNEVITNGIRGRGMSYGKSCDNCQYHTKDGRCLYFCGCPYSRRAEECD